MSVLFFFLPRRSDPPPTTVSTFTVAAQGPTAMALSWPETAGATYEVQTAPDGTTWEALTTTTDLSYTHTVLAADTRYYYRFRVNGGAWAYRYEYTDPAAPATLNIVSTYAALSGATQGEVAALNAFAQSGHTGGWWPYLIGFWPYVGATLNQKLFNLADPADLNDAFRQVILQAVADDPKGVKHTLANVDTLNTFVHPFNISNTPVIGSAYYVQGETSWVTRNNDTPYFAIHRASDGKAYPNVGISSSGVPFTGTPQAGLWLIQRKSLLTVDEYNNGTLVATENKTYTKDPIEWDITYEANPAQTFRPYVSHGGTVLSCYALFHAMPEAMVAAYQTAIIQLMNDLNRQVAL